jgi:Flp pilus assembly protein TadG
MKTNLTQTPGTGRSSQAGQSLVELAVSLGVILLLLAGAVDFGMGFYSYVALQDAAQEGALYASFQPYEDSDGNGKYTAGEGVNVDGIRQRIRASSTVPVDFSSLALVPDAYINAEAVTGKACEGTTVIDGVTTANGIRVTVEYDYPIITPFAGTVLGKQSIHLRAEVTDTILEPRCP